MELTLPWQESARSGLTSYRDIPTNDSCLIVPSYQVSSPPSKSCLLSFLKVSRPWHHLPLPVLADVVAFQWLPSFVFVPPKLGLSMGASAILGFGRGTRHPVPRRLPTTGRIHPSSFGWAERPEAEGSVCLSLPSIFAPHHCPFSHTGDPEHPSSPGLSHLALCPCFLFAASASPPSFSGGLASPHTLPHSLQGTPMAFFPNL